MIAAGLELAAREKLSPDEAARRVRRGSGAGEAPAAGTRPPRTLDVDPRVAVLFDMARQEHVAGDGIAFMQALEAEASAQIKPLPMNIDGALAAVLHDMGFPPAAGMFMFIIGRVAGLTAEVAEEYLRERPMRIKFDVEYDGVPPEPE